MNVCRPLCLKLWLDYQSRRENRKKKYIHSSVNTETVINYSELTCLNAPVRNRSDSMQPKSSAEKTGRKRCAARADQIKKTASSFSYDGICALFKISCSILDERTFTLIIKKILNVLYLSQEIISSRRTRQKLWIMNENKNEKTSKS